MSIDTALFVLRLLQQMATPYCAWLMQPLRFHGTTYPHTDRLELARLELARRTDQYVVRALTAEVLA